MGHVKSNTEHVYGAFGVRETLWQLVYGNLKIQSELSKFLSSNEACLLISLM